MQNTCELSDIKCCPPAYTNEESMAPRIPRHVNEKSRTCITTQRLTLGNAHPVPLDRNVPGPGMHYCAAFGTMPALTMTRILWRCHQSLDTRHSPLL